MIKRCSIIIEGILILFISVTLFGCVTTLPDTGTRTSPGTTAGAVWLMPVEIETAVGTDFATEMYIHTGNQKCAAYMFQLTYPPRIVDIDIDKGTSGVIPGPDGFLAAVNATDPGVIKIAGYDIYGIGPGDDLHILTLHWKALEIGYVKIKLTIINLNDEKTEVIGEYRGTGTKVKVR